MRRSPSKKTAALKSEAERGNRRSRTKPHAGTTSPPAILAPDDLRTIISDLATQLAPADVTELMTHEQKLRQQAAALTTVDLAPLRSQVGLALDVLRDHLDGACPQIPYYTVAVLAAAVHYFADEVDVIPDFLPHVGRLDDAAVMAMAWRMAHAGLRRYADWKGLGADAVLGPQPIRRKTPTASRRGS